MANSVDPDQTAPIRAVCSGSTLFACILNSSVMLGNCLQQRASADDFFRYIFSWRFKGLTSSIIRIHHECEGGIGESVTRITVWHHEACRVMTNVDPEGRIFLSHLHTTNGFFSCLPLNTAFHV